MLISTARARAAPCSRFAVCSIFITSTCRGRLLTHLELSTNINNQLKMYTYAFDMVRVTDMCAFDLSHACKHTEKII